MTAFTSLKHFKKDLRQGNSTCTKIVETCLQTIKHNLHFNSSLKIFELETLDKAAMIDRKINNGEELVRIVVGIKDILYYKERNINASCKILTDLNRNILQQQI